MITTVIAWVIANPWTAAFIIASTSYSIIQAKKMRKAMRDSAEARKGYEVVTTGDVQPIPIVYGRAKIGGTRVWHNTKGSHEVPQGFVPNANKVFDVGANPVDERTITYEEYDPEYGYSTLTKTIPPSSAGNLGITIPGSKNEFLYFQQVLCHGPINKVVDFVVDESRFSNDPDLGKIEGSQISSNTVKAGFRTEVHYDGSVANLLVSYNFGERQTAKFPGLAYASTAIRLNRDDPQFQGQVPMVQYFIEGRKVRTVSNGVLNNTRVYTNNPAWCLLDYLLENSDRLYEGKKLFEVGKGLALDQIDLLSFEQAAAICNQTVISSVPTYGNVWNSVDNSTITTTRSVPLYECNMIVDVEKPIRENIEAILACMGDARLVWSGGKYKLSLQYPNSNASVSLATTITDDDLIQGSKFELVWPTSSERLNNATVRFHNEAENFKEDSVSWPPKQSAQYFKGIGGKRYANSENTDGALLSSYGVWQGGTYNPPPFNWKFIAKATGAHVLQFQVDNYGSISITNNSTGASVFSSSFSGASTVHVRNNINLVENQVYSVVITAVNTGGPGGVAARLSKDNFIYWSTKDPAYEAFTLVNVSDAVYQSMLTEDSGLKLETTMFYDGCTDYYHALAKAEELVRTSRSAISVSFEYLVKDKFLEPGDFIKIESPSLNLGDEDFYVRVAEVKLSETGTCEVKGSRFDYTQLAWNVNDNEYTTPPNIFGFRVPAPRQIIYVPIQNIGDSTSIGELQWTPVDFDSFAGYVVYYNTFDNYDSNGLPIFIELGRTVASNFVLPALNIDSAVFAVRAVSKSNRYSKYVTTGNTAVRIPKIFPRAVEVTAPSLFFIQRANSINFVSNQITLTTTIKNYLEPQYRWFVDNTLIVGATSDSLTINSFATGLSKRYRVEVYEASNEETQAEDFVTIYSIQEGSSGYTVLLSNESRQIIANYEGLVAPNQFPYQIQVTVLRGTENVTAGATISLGTLTGISATLSSDIITVNALNAITGTGLVSIAIDNVTLTKLFYITKIVPGRSPEVLRLTSNRYGFPFETSESTTPFVSQIDFNVFLENIDGVVTVVAKAYSYENALLGQFSIIPDQNNEFVITDTQFNQFDETNTAYVTVTASLEDLSDTITVFRVNDGQSVFNFNLENESHLVPATFEGQITDLDEAYTPLRTYRGFTEVTAASTFSIFASNGGTAIITGNGTSNVTLSLLTMSEDVATFTVLAVIPTGVVVDNVPQTVSLKKVFSVAKARDGAPGTPGTKALIVYAFKRSITAPTTSPGSATYSFTLANFTTALANGWTETIPEYIDQDHELYVSVATVIDSNNDNLAAVASNDWSSPVVYSANSFSSASVFLYKRTETDVPLPEPQTANGQPSEYTFRTKELTNIPTGWSTLIPAKGQNDRYLWVSVATVASSTESDLILGGPTSSEWSVPTILSEKGEDAIAFVGFLTNDSHVLAASSTGVVSDYSGATGQFLVYLNGQPATGVTYAYVSSTGFSTAPTGSINANTGVYTITGIGSGGSINSNVNNATVVYSATVNSVVVATQTFTISKAKAGVNGQTPTLYRLLANTSAVKLTKTLDTYIPGTLTFDAFSKTGTADWTGATVRIDIEGSVGGTSWTQLATVSSGTSLSHILATTGTTYRFFRGLLKVNSVTIENEVIPVVVDGADGDPGDYVSYVFKESANQPITPSSTDVVPAGWSDTLPASYTEPVWMTKATISGVTGLAGTWDPPIKVTGTDGDEGQYTYYEYAKNSDFLAAPTTGWSNTVPSITYGEYLWLRPVAFEPATNTATTGNAFRATGEKGNPGDPSYSIKIVASSLIFKNSKAGVVSPDYITLTAVRQNLYNVVNWSGFTVRSGTSPSSSIVTTGTTVYLHKADFIGNSVSITATPSFPSNINDTVSILMVQEGLDAISVSNSNPTHTINAYAGGQAISMSGSGTTIGVYAGATPLSYSATQGTLGTFTITSVTKNNITTGVINSGTIPDHTGMTDSATEGSVTYNIAYTTANNISGTISTTQTFIKNILVAGASLSATAVTFTYNVDNTLSSPASSTITASSVNVLNPYYVFKKGITTLQEGTGTSLTYTPAASYLNMPETITVQVYKDSSKASVLASNSIALNATRVGATGSGAPGAATFYINRGTSSSSAVPTDAEVLAAIGRYSVIGDLATISYNSGVNAISYRCTAPYPSASWSVQSSFLSGDLFVSGSISGDKIDTNTLTAKTIRTATTGQRVEINQGNSNEVVFFGNQGDGTITELARIGIQSVGQDDFTVLEAGTSNSSHVGGYFVSGTNRALEAVSIWRNAFSGVAFKNAPGPVGGDTTVAYGMHASGYGAYTGGVFGYATGGVNNTGVHGWSNGSSGQNQFSRGVWGASVNGVGVFGDGATYDFYAGGSGSNYGPFTGTHDGLVDNNDTLELGDIVVDAEILHKYSLSSCLFRNTKSTVAAQKGVVGVVSAIKPITLESLPAALIDDYIQETGDALPIANADQIIGNRYRIMINALGEGQINVCGENGNIEVGDLIISSSMPGKGMKQADDIVRSYTVARAREAVNFDSPTDVRQIACIYLCG
jgi:hypothetical protein